MLKNNFLKRLQTTIILLFLLILMVKYNLFSVYALIVLGVFSVLEFIEMTKKSFSKKKLYLINSLFIIYIVFFSFLFFYFLNYPHLRYIIFALLIGCVASDLGGYIVGKTFNGPRLTKISPNKTYSGAVGSIVFTCLIIYTLTNLFKINFTYLILTVSFFTSIGCQLGDLFFSYFKRKAKIKDTGKILPGHGGVLDRVDGILLGIPVGIITLNILS